MPNYLQKRRIEFFAFLFLKFQEKRFTAKFHIQFLFLTLLITKKQMIRTLFASRPFAFILFKSSSFSPPKEVGVFSTEIKTFYSSVSPVCFGKNKLRSNDTTNTPATAFPLKISPTAAGNAAKKFPSV